ncbi:MAG: hypothetical protein ABI690_01175 [Chloroflexota bacterium]
MSRKKWMIAGGAGLVVVIIAVVLLLTRTGSPAASNDGLTRTFNNSPTGFTFRYPDGWQYTIPMQGLLVIGAADTMNNSTPGPTFTVQRSEPLSVYGTLDDALELYLRRGPMRPDRSWAKLGEIAKSTFAGRDALVVDIQGKENEVSPELRAHVLITTSQNTFVYTIILTAPAADWATQEPTLTAMLNSLQMSE